MKIPFKTLLLASTVAAVMGGEAQASVVEYTLDQSNEESQFPDNNPYLKVTIQDGLTFGTDTDAIKFTVTINNLKFTPDSNFGIQEFVFNQATGAPTVTTADIIGPAGWNANVGVNNFDGFGDFKIKLSGNGNNRQSPLVFWISGVTGDTVSSYVALSANNSGQGNVYFGAHVADFTGDVTSAKFGGSTEGGGGISEVPVPAAVWMFGSALVGLTGFGRRKAQITA